MNTVVALSDADTAANLKLIQSVTGHSPFMTPEAAAIVLTSLLRGMSTLQQTVEGSPSIKQEWGTCSDIAKIYGKNRSTITRLIGPMAAEGKIRTCTTPQVPMVPPCTTLQTCNAASWKTPEKRPSKADNLLRHRNNAPHELCQMSQRRRYIFGFFTHHYHPPCCTKFTLTRSFHTNYAFYTHLICCAISRPNCDISCDISPIRCDICRGRLLLLAPFASAK